MVCHTLNVSSSRDRPPARPSCLASPLSATTTRDPPTPTMSRVWCNAPSRLLGAASSAADRPRGPCASLPSYADRGERWCCCHNSRRRIPAAAGVVLKKARPTCPVHSTAQRGSASAGPSLLGNQRIQIHQTTHAPVVFAAAFAAAKACCSSGWPAVVPAAAVTSNGNTPGLTTTSQHPTWGVAAAAAAVAAWICAAASWTQSVRMSDSRTGICTLLSWCSTWSCCCNALHSSTRHSTARHRYEAANGMGSGRQQARKPASDMLAAQHAAL